MPFAVRGYENQVKIFLILVVLFLVTANLITVTFLNRTEMLLVEEASARVLTTAQAMARQVEAERIAGPVLEARPGAATAAAAKLSDLGGAHATVLAEIVDSGGRVVASSQTWRHGNIEPLETALGGPALSLLRSGRPALVPPAGEGDPLIVYVPIETGDGKQPLYLRTGHLLAATGTISSQIRFLTWTQGVGGTIVLILVLMFSRFVLKPYRELRATAESLEPAGEIRADPGDPAFLVASFRGVVEKMRSVEAELERMKRGPSSAGGEESLLEGLSSGVLILDASGTIVALNRAGEAILRATGAGMVGRRAAEALSSSPEFSALLEEAVRHGRSRTREMVPFRTAGGGTVHLGVTISSPPGGGGGALCLFSDLTEIRSVQARVMLKENLARLGELSAGIAHEFRNSLGTILGYARLISRGGDGADENAQGIIREVGSMDRLVNEFLRYAGPARLQKAPCDLRSIVEETLEEVVRGAGRRVKVSIRGEWPAELEADESLLRQAFNNLLRNAVEAAASGAPPHEVSVCAHLAGGSVSVEVEDNGPGFPEEILAKLFTPFVSTKQRGTGLGMALAQKAIISHDGGIEAGNGEGGGGRVAVTLPLG